MAQEIDLRALIKLIIRRKKIIVGGTLGCVILAFAVSFIIPEAYESSLILEVGRIYLSSQAWKQELQFIEEPEATAEVMESFGILDEVRRKLRLDVTLKSLGKQLEVNTFVKDKEYLPVLEIISEGESPQQAVDILNTLAAMVIARHTDKYQVYRKGLEERIKYNQEKIAAFKKIISAQEKYRDLSQQYIDQGQISADEFVKELGKLDSSSPSAVDMLYLQGSVLTEKQQVRDLTRFKAEMDMRIGQNQKEMADAEIDIVELQSRLELSSPTRIISPAVPIDKPVKPNRPLIVLLAAVIGFALMILIVAGRQYLQE
ncbi:MAG: Wzz/FepE/Etk N-terminal domain-containing protein [PVC group bacterium]